MQYNAVLHIHLEGLSPTVPRQPCKSLLTVQLPCMDRLSVWPASSPECLKKMAKQDRKQSSCRAEDSAKVDSGKEITLFLDARHAVWPLSASCLLVLSQLLVCWKPAPTPSGLLCAALRTIGPPLSQDIDVYSAQNDTVSLIPYLTAEPCLSWGGALEPVSAFLRARASSTLLSWLPIMR